MTRFALLPLALLAACGEPDPTEDPDTDPVDPSTASAEPIAVAVYLRPVGNGSVAYGTELCSELGCGPVTAGQAEVLVPPDSDVELLVRGSEFVQQTYQFHSPTAGFELTLEAASLEDAALIAGHFGEIIDQETAVIAQLVQHPTGVTPDLGGVGRGPYYIDGGDMPQPDATDTSQYAWYFFFGVPPGTHELRLPGCDESEWFWGTPGDQAITVDVVAGDVLGLLPAICG